MKMEIVAIEDVFNGFNKPATVINLEGAKRDFRILMKESPVATDQRLWHLGSMNTETGELTPLEKPELLEKGFNDENSLGKNQN